MSRLLFLLCLVAAAAIAGVLFQVKYEVQDLERELAQVNRQILLDQEAVHVLRTEWSYLNQPARIAELARRHLELGPMKPEQIASVSLLPPRPEDFGYTRAALEGSGPEPRQRPDTPAGWQPRRVQPAPVRQPAPETRQAAAPAPAPILEEEVTGLVAEASVTTIEELLHNLVTERPQPISATLGEGQR